MMIVLMIIINVPELWGGTYEVKSTKKKRKRRREKRKKGENLYPCRWPSLRKISRVNELNYFRRIFGKEASEALNL